MSISRHSVCRRAAERVERVLHALVAELGVPAVAARDRARLTADRLRAEAPGRGPGGGGDCWFRSSTTWRHARGRGDAEVSVPSAVID